MRLRSLCEDEFGPLVDYGITTEKSTHRIHICPKVGRAYIFETSEGIWAIKYGKGKRTLGWTDILSDPKDDPHNPDDPSFCRIHGVYMKEWHKNGRSWYSHLSILEGKYANHKSIPEWCNGKCEIVTAIGYRVPPNAINGCREILIPPTLLERLNFSQSDSVGDKGIKAETLVHNLFQYNLIPINMQVETIDSTAFQIKGCDLTSHSMNIIQVKCDFEGGSRKYGGTGYLYLQTKERNPFDQTSNGNDHNGDLPDLPELQIPD